MSTPDFSSLNILSDLVFYRTYASTKSSGFKESYDETVDRVMNMHIDKFPKYTDPIVSAFSFVRRKIVVPSMRTMQFAGMPMLRGPLRAFNCFSRETQFLTDKGLKSFNDFEDGDAVTVLSKRHQWKKATVRKFGKEKIYELKVGYGRTGISVLRTTGNHRWPTIDSSDHWKIVETKDLKPGMKLCKNKPATYLGNYCNIGLMHGIVFGDGTKESTRKSNFSVPTCIVLCDESVELHRFFVSGRHNASPIVDGRVRTDRYTIHGLPANWKDLPVDMNRRYLLGFMMGWFASDGYVSSNGQASLASSSKEKLEWAESVLQLLGIQTSSIRLVRSVSPFSGEPSELYELKFRNDGHLTSEFFIRTKHLERFVKPELKHEWRVISVTETQCEEEVWCVQEPETQTFTLKNGLLTMNCTYMPIDTIDTFGDIFYALACGCGVGFSVQRKHVECLPSVAHGTPGHFVVPDSREGWSDSFKELIKNPSCEFVYVYVRPAGSILSTGGTASGPVPLRAAHDSVRKILKQAAGRKLRPIEVHDIACHIADSVVVGGVRRSACISLFDATDDEMLSAKSGNWWEKNPQRGRSNNSAVLLREDENFNEKFYEILIRCFDSGAGEPGLSLSACNDWGFNPCHEVSLKAVCNLTEINAAACNSKIDFLQAVNAATFIGKLQSTYTEFGYMQPRFRQWAEEERLLGVSITGQADAWGLIGDPEVLAAASAEALRTDEEWSTALGIGLAHRIGTTKPSGTTSLFLGTSSGIHAAHAPFYLRRVRIDESDPIAKYLMSTFGVSEACSGSVVERDQFASNNIVVSVPVKRMGSILRTNESAKQLMERAKHIYKNWILPTHRQGPNPHNVSLTVNYKPSEKGQVINWMLQNKEFYSGISLLPYSDSSYVQMPFEEITMSDYLDWKDKFNGVSLNFADVNFLGTQDKRQGEVACGGGSCELRNL